MEPAQRWSLVLRKLHLLLGILLLASLAAPVTGWLVPQPKANVWATLARAMGQDHICLSATSADSPLMTCLVRIPYGPKELPTKPLEITEQTNREGASKGQEKSYQFVYQTKKVYTARIWCDWIAHVEMASMTEEKPLTLPKVRAAVGEAIILHYMDDVLVCAPNDDLLSHALDLTINSLVAAGFKLQEEKIQRMLPWKYLGLEIGPWLGLTTEDLDAIFNLLKGGEELSSPRTLTQEARAALEKVQDCMATRQANRCKSALPFKFIIVGKLPHLHGMIFQWERVEKSKKDKDCRDPLLIIEWVFLSHHRSKRMTRPQELVAELIQKARTRIRELAGCDFECIHIPIERNSGQITKAMLEHLIHENETLQFALDSYTGQISIHRPAHKLFREQIQFKLPFKIVQSRRPLKALTVFTDAPGTSHKSVITWKNPQTQQWEKDIVEVEGSPQVDELAAVVKSF
ncbi:hypothetical protein DUI87_32233 [Hirundo rustica rustica]|uniref:Reverse transcriptase thumb domain-containing protein n=1 Tax=Hirundo rustica rustica TaxID=333673 RepID=A0A3M0IPR0_HIRRU|nr:hypothetical protein DUI87_32233 [Hirundo rustica rustica]